MMFKTSERLVGDGVRFEIFPGVKLSDRRPFFASHAPLFLASGRPWAAVPSSLALQRLPAERDMTIQDRHGTSSAQGAPSGSKSERRI
jgi:hypothetical protein